MITSIPMELLRAFRLTIVVFAVTGLAYPLAITGVAGVAFPAQAAGSLVMRQGQVVGSSLIGQNFSSPRYFHGRPSATVDASSGKPRPYAADNSAGSNLAPSNQALSDRVRGQVDTERKEDGIRGPVPVDLVTTDFSGFDPDISEAAAMVQVNRVARARGLDPQEVHDLVEKNVVGRMFLVFGEAHVNVLQLNLALDRL
ncbi:MAG: potassium-transporting ATPase subunit KdpC [Candidatus Dormibacteria bacterium]